MSSPIENAAPMNVPLGVRTPEQRRAEQDELLVAPSQERHLLGAGAPM